MKKCLWAWLALALFAGCGGGADSETPSARASASSSKKAEPEAPTRSEAASRAADAERLFDFAQWEFQKHFPSGPSTQSHGPFLFRHYPETSTYIGVVTEPDMGYEFNGVYLMGGPFGSEPSFVGLLSDFIVPQDPQLAQPDNGCYDLDAMEAAGRHVVVHFRYAGDKSGTQVRSILVTGPKAFAGHSTVESITKTSDSYTFSGASHSLHYESRAYSKRSGDTEVTEYGEVATTEGIPGARTIVYEPPVINNQYALRIGQSAAVFYAGTETVTRSGTQSVSTDIGKGPNTYRFLGRESITVPAGVYDTCRFEYSEEFGVYTLWVMHGHGIAVKFTSREPELGTWHREATSVTLNGRPL